jgi:hypothetical protein
MAVEVHPEMRLGDDRVAGQDAAEVEVQQRAVVVRAVPADLEARRSTVAGGRVRLVDRTVEPAVVEDPLRVDADRPVDEVRKHPRAVRRERQAPPGAVPHDAHRHRMRGAAREARSARRRVVVHVRRRDREGRAAAAVAEGDAAVGALLGLEAAVERQPVGVLVRRRRVAHRQRLAHPARRRAVAHRRARQDLVEGLDAPRRGTGDVTGAVELERHRVIAARQRHRTVRQRAGQTQPVPIGGDARAGAVRHQAVVDSAPRALRVPVVHRDRRDARDDGPVGLHVAARERRRQALDRSASGRAKRPLVGRSLRRDPGAVLIAVARNSRAAASDWTMSEWPTTTGPRSCAPPGLGVADEVASTKPSPARAHTKAADTTRSARTRAADTTPP